MLIRKKFSFKYDSKWKMITLADDTFLVNSDSTKDFIKVNKRVRCSKEIEFEETIEDIELYATDNGFVFKFYDDIYEIEGVFEIDFIELINYDVNNDDVLLIASHGANRLSFITFWHDENSGEVETFQELKTINLSSLPSIKNLDHFMKMLFYNGNFFYYQNSKGDRLLLRFNSEKFDIYEVPEDSTFYTDNKYEKYFYVRFENSLIDVLKFKLYDITDSINALGDNINRYNVAIFNLSDPLIDFIFWFDNRDVYSPNLITSGTFTKTNGLLYDYTYKRFIFDSSSESPTIHTFMLYDYSVPNIISSENGYTAFYMGQDGSLTCYSLSSDITILSCSAKASTYNRFIFVKDEKDYLEEKNSVILINNSVFLNNIIWFASLNKIVFTDEEEDSIKLTIANRFNRNIASKVQSINSSSYKKIYYLHADDCITIKTPLSEYGKYTLLIPSQKDMIDYSLSFNSFRRFIVCRKSTDKKWEDHLILKCIYREADEVDKIAYIDVTNQEIVSIEELIDESFNY